MFRRSASDGGLPGQSMPARRRACSPGGALSGSAERHPIAIPPPEPIGSTPISCALLA
jgi:hypothetical protein